MRLVPEQSYYPLFCLADAATEQRRNTMVTDPPTPAVHLCSEYAVNIDCYGDAFNTCNIKGNSWYELTGSSVGWTSYHTL